MEENEKPKKPRKKRTNFTRKIAKPTGPDCRSVVDNEYEPDSGGGRPPLRVIKYQDVARMMQIQCTREEIAYIVRLTPDALEDYIKRRYGTTFSAMYNENCNIGKQSLRRELFRLALNSKDESIRYRACHWLSKQHLGMKEQPEAVTIDVTPVIIEGLDGTTVTLTTERPNNEQPTSNSDPMWSGTNSRK